MTEAEQAGIVVEVNPDLPTPQSDPSTGPLPGIGAPVIDPVILTNADIQSYAQSYGEKYPEVLAREIIADQAVDHPDLTYEGLIDGTSPMFDRIAEYASKTPAQRALDANAIINGFAVSPDGKPVEDLPFFEAFTKGMRREAPGAIASSIAGFKTGKSILAATAGKTHPAVSFGLATFGGLGSAVLTYAGVDFGRQAIFGPEDVMTPGTRRVYEMGRSTMGALSAAPFPFLVAKTPVTAAQDYLRKTLSDQLPVGPLTKNAMSTLQKRGLGVTVKQETTRLAQTKKAGQKMIEELREKGDAESLRKAEEIAETIKGLPDAPFVAPRSARIPAALESGLTASGQAARAKPGTTVGIEALPVMATPYLVGVAEENYPGQTGARITAEVAGGIVPAIAGASLVPKLVGFIPELNKIRKNIADKGFKQGIAEASEGIKTRREQKAIDQIVEVLNLYGEDIDEVISRLSSRELDEILYDESGKRIQLTAGAKAGSPGLIAIEAALDQLGNKIGATRDEANRKAMMALQNTIVSLVLTNDSEALQLAGTLAKEAFDVSFLNKIDRAQANLVNAFNRVVMGESDETAQKRTTKLSSDLFKIIEENLSAARAQERKLWQAIPPTTLTQFVDADGNVSDVPGFIQRWASLTEKEKAIFEKELISEGQFQFLDQYVRDRAKDFGFRFTSDATDSGDGAVVAASDDVASGLGKEKTDLYQPALNMMPDRGDSPAGFRVFQRKGEEKGFVTTVMDSAGNRVELRLDPSDRITPYTATIINGTGPDAYRAGATSDTVPLAGPTNVQEAVAMARVRMSSGGDFKFTPQPAAKADSSGTVPTQPKEKLPPLVRDRTETPVDDPITLRELQEARSSALNKGRKLASQGSLDEARIAFELADALLQDMNSISRTEAGAAYEIARSYSRSLNDTFTRSFAGQQMRKTPSGAYRNAPELFWQAAEAGTSDATTLRLQQVMEIPNFAIENGVGRQTITLMDGTEVEFDPNTAKASVTNAIDALLRDAHFTVSRDPVTGEMKERAFKAWMEQHDDLLNQFPALKRDLNNFERRQALLDKRRLQFNDQSKRTRSMVTFMDLIPAGALGEGTGTTSPTTAVSRAMAKSNKEKLPAMLRLLSYAENAPEKIRADALNGYKNAVIDWALTEAGQTGGIVNPRNLYNLLFTPPERGLGKGVFNVPLVEFLVKSNAMPQEQADRLKKYVTDMVQFEATRAGGGDIAEVTKKVNAGLAVWAKISGSAAGTRVYSFLTGGQGGPGSITAAGIGAKAVSDVVDRLPESLAGDVMHRILSDADLLAILLRRPKTDKEALRIAKRLEDKLIDYGMIVPRRSSYALPREATRDEETYTEPALNVRPPLKAPTAEPQASVQAPQQNLMAQRFARSQPTVIQPRPAAPAPIAQAPAPPQGAANPQQRQQLAAMFPNDPILGAAGGIGSLFS
jgi:hypothetical protein